MINLRNFETAEAYNAELQGGTLAEPNVSFIQELDDVLYVEQPGDVVVMTTANNENPKIKPEGDGWTKVVDVESSDGYWTINGEGHYTQDPTYQESNEFDYIHDEASWNASAADGGLKLYYAANPDEDRWNYNANRWAWEADKVDGEWPDYCVQCWQGAINAPGAMYPWIVPYFSTDVDAKLIFRYEGKDDVKPWSDIIFGNGEGHKTWGCASVPQELGNEFLLDKNTGETSFDESKFKLILEKQGVEYVPAVDEEYHWEKTVIAPVVDGE